MNSLFRIALLTIVATAIPSLADPASDSPQPSVSVMALAGYAPLSGKGVIITLNDRKMSSLKGVTEAIPGLVHDYDVLTIVNELRFAGAQGITVGGVRLTNQSSVNCVGPLLFVDKTPIAIPVRIEAIGNTALLDARLGIKGGVLEGFKAEGPSVQVQSARKLRLDAAPLPANLDEPHTTN